MIISFIDIFTLSLNSFKFSTLVFYFDGVDSIVWKPVRKLFLMQRNC